ncbi:MAG: hypothetical protein KVP17_001287 [Porospora cf. gigantea B]|uniref:uncharacterized protein n=2 Tax=Porospora cf. gigantea B TaxID=2853592 RepID=UPI003571A93D|nr:MAG: hypothetical protein KVP17_001287 [Porospora cf. gigantea B]
MISYRFLHETAASDRTVGVPGVSAVTLSELKNLIARQDGLDAKLFRFIDLVIFENGVQLDEGQSVSVGSSVVVERRRLKDVGTIIQSAQMELQTTSGTSEFGKVVPSECLCVMCSHPLSDPVIIRCTNLSLKLCRGASVCRGCVDAHFTAQAQATDYDGVQRCPLCAARVRNVIANKALAKILESMDFATYQLPKEETKEGVVKSENGIQVPVLPDASYAVVVEEVCLDPMKATEYVLTEEDVSLLKSMEAVSLVIPFFPTSADLAPVLQSGLVTLQCRFLEHRVSVKGPAFLLPMTVTGGKTSFSIAGLCKAALTLEPNQYQLTWVERYTPPVMLPIRSQPFVGILTPLFGGTTVQVADVDPELLSAVLSKIRSSQASTASAPIDFDAYEEAIPPPPPSSPPSHITRQVELGNDEQPYALYVAGHVPFLSREEFEVVKALQLATKGVEG